MKKIIFFLFGMVLLGLYSCKDVTVGQYGVETVAPDTLSDFIVENFDGYSIINYTLPDDDDLRYVVATYQLDNGQKMEVKASAFTTNVKLEGFGKGDSIRPVVLRVVDLSENTSLPVTVNVKPKASPIYQVLDSLRGYNDYGGITVKWKNPKKANVIVIVRNPENYRTPADSLRKVPSVVAMGGTAKYYTNAADGYASVSGYDSVRTTFYFQVTDKWGNKTRIDSIRVKPKFEEVVSKAYFKRWNGDAAIPYQEYNSGFGIEKMWNNIWGASSGQECYSSRSGAGLSNNITWDLNNTATDGTGKGYVSLTRIRIHGRYGNSATQYGFNALPKTFRIYGSTNPLVSMNSTDPESQWILLKPATGGDLFYLAKPSGLGGTGSNITSADLTAINESGIDIRFQDDMPYIRFIRIEQVDMWNATTNTGFNYGEISLWGKVKK